MKPNSYTDPRCKCGGQMTGKSVFLPEEVSWYMIRMFPWNNLSCGGVRVTEKFEVLGWDLKPVGGFYAAGETVAGVHGAFYCGGNACGFAHTSGFMAGKYATGYKEA